MSLADKKPKPRDDRDFDTTYLKEDGFHASLLHRDYSAHFFRWSFVRRHITRKDDVLDVGCGPDQPLHKMLVRDVRHPFHTYTGVDLNPLKGSKMKNCTFLGEFNFIERWKELKPNSYDIAVCMEVIEHMNVKYGPELLRGIHALLRPGGRLFLSTPCYDGRRHASNHIHEYEISELEDLLLASGFSVFDRFGTFMDVKYLKNTTKEVFNVSKYLSRYYDNDALACIFAPLFPDQARNNLWICEKGNRLL